MNKKAFIITKERLNELETLFNSPEEKRRRQIEKELLALFRQQEVISEEEKDMNFSKYYDSEQFTANKMHTRAALAITNKDYQPPPDIQLFYLLEIINDFAALGYCEFKFNTQLVDFNKDVYKKLRELGYTIEKDVDTVTIRWNY